MTHTIIWFRKGLRLCDNPALLAAAVRATQLWPIFILDPWFVNPARVGHNRMLFLLDSLRDLDVQLRRLGSRLFVLRGQPQEVLEERFDTWQIGRLCFERDTEPYARDRDSRVSAYAQGRGIDVISPTAHTLFDPDLTIAAGGHAPATYSAFLRVLKKLGDPARPLDAPRDLPPPGECDPEAHGIPTLGELGYDVTDDRQPVHQGGETAGRERLNAYLSNQGRVASFAKPATDPTAFDPPSTTALGPHLKFGCLSARTFYHGVQDVYKEAGTHTEPPVSLLAQILWREFFYTLGYATPNYDRMEGNPLSRQIPWDDNPEYLTAWSEARTGYPWIDAAMSQLATEGWLHHLTRHCVACFLTRGDLWQSWEKGQAVFDRLLVDQDWSLNASNWMWLSASAFFHAYHRVYGPVSFAKKYDPEGRFVRHYLPVVARLPKEFIYEPWKAPLSVQRSTGCVIGRDYPGPIVEHEKVKTHNIERMRLAFEAARNTEVSRSTVLG
ncbi:MAG: DNA photolyase family protein [Gemmatimonadaceae bacterium]|nr:DNA photolyase family protein [Gloeobacterales cyanobacterium ES-bin-141]